MGFFNSVVDAVSKSIEKSKKDTIRHVRETDKRVSEYERRTDLSKAQREKVAEVRKRVDNAKNTLGI